jgi:tRNA dimethylallyltransferase
MIIATLCGATGVGKSGIAYKLAEANGWEIISADSRQIYKGLEVGTAQVNMHWRKNIPHHFMGFLSPSQKYSIHHYRRDVYALLELHPKKKFLVVGGTGMYIKALFYPQKEERPPIPSRIKHEVAVRLEAAGPSGLHRELTTLDPAAAAGIHPNDAYRTTKAYENILTTGKSYREYEAETQKEPTFRDAPLIWITRERKALYDIINSRVEEMLQDGWIDEVKKLLENDVHASHPCFHSLGYREVAEYLCGKLKKPDMLDKIKRNTRKYAKRQITFFKHQFPESQVWDYSTFLESMEIYQSKWDAMTKCFK